MKTLIELYDDSPIENVLAADTFFPEHVIFLCPSKVAQDKDKLKKMREYFQHRGLETEVIFLDTSLYYANKVEKQLRNVVSQYPDCAIDIAGGSDASLFAAGMACKEGNLSVFTHSRKKKRFFDISNAAFADNLPFSARYTVEDFFLMAYGAVKPGRVDNAQLEHYEADIDPFFSLFLKYRRKWGTFVNWMQRASAADQNGQFSLSVCCPYYLKGERGSQIEANEEILCDLEEIGFLEQVGIKDREEVHFQFRDEQIRYWLRDQGSVLEIYTWKACRDAGVFQDVRCSTVVEWERETNGEKVTNEIDVIAVQEATPVFISCKTCMIDTDAINELAILRERFGGDASEAIIVSTEDCRAITRRRAEALDISIIALSDLSACNLSDQIRSLI